VHGVGVDGELGDYLLRSRRLVAGLERAHPQGLVDLLGELEVGGDARRLVELELDRTV
jgi:hypothetical protein